jgi:hypothetical protein
MDGPKSRLVYSTEPKPLQMKLPTGADAVFAEMFQALRRQAPRDDGTSIPDEGIPMRTDLVIDHKWTSRGDYLNFLVIAYDIAGREIGRADTAASDPKEVIRLAPYEAPDVDSRTVGLVPPPKKQKPPLELSEQNREVIRERAGEARITPTIRDILMRPLEQDPVELTGGILIAYAKRKHEQLVANGSDSMASALAFRGADEDEVWDEIKDDGTIEANGWLTIQRSAVDPELQFDTFDRHRLQIFVDSVVDETLPKLLTVIRADRLGLEGIARTAQSALFPHLVRDDSDLSQCLARLSDPQIKSLLAGERVNVLDIPSEFREQFVENCFDWCEFELRREGDDIFSKGQIEPTELVDTRLPPSSFLALDQSVHRSFECASAVGRASEFMDIDGLADEFLLGSATPKMRVGSERRFTLKCYLVSGVYWESSGSVHEVPANSPFVTTNGLSPELRSELSRLVNEKRKAMDSNTDGKTTPPQ